jgi:protein SCO1/2
LAALALTVFLLPFPVPQASAQETIGLDEKLGETVPLDLVFHDEDGKPIKLRDAITGPTVLSLVYFTCPGICTPLLNSTVQLVNKTPLEPGEDFRLLTVSFDPNDTPAVAKAKKQNYLSQIKRPFPPDHWMWLTGDADAIRQLTDAVGFRYEKQGEAFVHPATLIVLSPKGKIARYLLGLSFQPFDLKMALAEASQERTGPTIRKALLLCFSYDPESRRYVANVTRIGGAATLLLALIFVVVVLLRGKRDKTKDQLPRGEAHGE